MQRMAQRLIEAVQNTLLDTLFVRLLPFLMLSDLWGRVFERRSASELQLGLILMAAGLLFLSWLVGFLAIHERSNGVWILERAEGAAANGFDAWSQRPPAGLKPPGAMRALVTVVGTPTPLPARTMTWLGLIVLAGWLGAYFGLEFGSNGLLAAVSPILAAPGVRHDLILGLVVIALLMIVRDWAVYSRANLAPEWT